MNKNTNPPQHNTLLKEQRQSIYKGTPKRLDKVLTEIWPDISRANWQSLVKAGNISISGEVILSNNTQIKPGSEISATIPAPTPALPQPENIPLDILYEDAHLIVFNKPAGISVHPATGCYTGTIVNALLYHCQSDLSGIGGVIRPGIVHRLDKETSGVMVAAKNDHAHHHLSQQFANREIHRLYTALVWGHLQPPSGRIEGNIGRHPVNRKKMAIVASSGKYAATSYCTLKTYTPASLPKVSMIQCKLETGRTHQIRVHLTSIGHPLVGDPVYTQKSYKSIKIFLDETPNPAPFSRQALHASELQFTHPVTQKLNMYKSEFPLDINSLVTLLEK